MADCIAPLCGDNCKHCVGTDRREKRLAALETEECPQCGSRRMLKIDEYVAVCPGCKHREIYF